MNPRTQFVGGVVALVLAVLVGATLFIWRLDNPELTETQLMIRYWKEYAAAAVLFVAAAVLLRGAR